MSINTLQQKRKLSVEKLSPGGFVGKAPNQTRDSKKFAKVGLDNQNIPKIK